MFAALSILSSYAYRTHSQLFILLQFVEGCYAMAGLI